jgi:hypothetical protein
VKRLVLIAAFPSILVLGACSGEDSGVGGGSELGTIHGTVLLGPTCPVETESSPCPDQPAAGVEVRAMRDGAVSATAVTDANGAFVMDDLGAGEYLLRAVVEPEGPGMFAKSTRVTVPEGGVVDVTVLLDTGIRAPVGVGDG